MFPILSIVSSTVVENKYLNGLLFLLVLLFPVLVLIRFQMAFGLLPDSAIFAVFICCLICSCSHILFLISTCIV